MHGRKYYLSTAEDVALAYIVYQNIKETTETGEQQDILDFYHKYLEIPDKVYTLEDLLRSWNSIGKHLGKERFRQKVVDVLTDRLGYLEKFPQPDNKKYNLYKPVMFVETEKNDVKTENDEKESNNSDTTLDSLISNIRVSLVPKLEKTAREWVSDNLKKNGSIEDKKSEDILIKKLLYINDKILRLSNNDVEQSDKEEEGGHSLISGIRVSKAMQGEKKAEEAEEINLDDLLESSTKPETKKTIEQIEQQKKDDDDFVADIESLGDKKMKNQYKPFIYGRVIQSIRNMEVYI